MAMGQLGVHFAIDAATAHRLLAAGDDESVMAIIEEIEEEMVDVYDCGTDKAWDAIHRSLTDGFLGYDNGEYPRNAAILGGFQIEPRLAQVGVEDRHGGRHVGGGHSWSDGGCSRAWADARWFSR